MNKFFLFSFIGLVWLLVATAGASSLAAQALDNLENKKIGSKNSTDCPTQTKFDLYPLTNTNVSERTHKQTLVYDIGCAKSLSTIDMIWNRSNEVQYGFTLKIVSDEKNVENEFSYLSDLLPVNTLQSAGLENTVGRFIILTINEPANITTNEAIQRISINAGQKEPVKPIIGENVFDRMSKKYFSNIIIGNSNITSVAGLYRITDGDDIDEINPHSKINNFLDLTNKSTIFVKVPYEHIEGISAIIDSYKPPYYLKSLNETFGGDDSSKMMTYYFNIDKNRLTDPNRVENLTVMLATSSETSLYYKAIVRLN